MNWHNLCSPRSLLNSGLLSVVLLFACKRRPTDRLFIVSVGETWWKHLHFGIATFDFVLRAPLSCSTHDRLTDCNCENTIDLVWVIKFVTSKYYWRCRCRLHWMECKKEGFAVFSTSVSWLADGRAHQFFRTRQVKNSLPTLSTDWLR